jgi:hypothetical protein
MSKTHPWYDRQCWRGPNGLRLFILRRDPICVLCQREYSTVADHVIPFRTGDTEAACWELFTSASNLRGLCAPCHDSLGDKTKATTIGQRIGRAPRKPPGVEIVTDHGVKYVTSSLPTAVLDKALGSPEELAELLGDRDQTREPS